MSEMVAVSTRWLTFYTLFMAVGGLFGIIRSASTPPGGALLVDIGSSALSFVVAVGLLKRQRWAWKLNYWGFLFIPLVVAGVLVGLGVVAVLMVPVLIFDVLGARALLGPWTFGVGFQEILVGLVVGLVLGLWSSLNRRYFRRRRHLFSG